MSDIRTSENNSKIWHNNITVGLNYQLLVQSTNYKLPLISCPGSFDTVVSIMINKISYEALNLEKHIPYHQHPPANKWTL